MSQHPQHLRLSPSSAAETLLQSLRAADPNLDEYDKEDNTDSQWGHGIYTSALMDAGLKDWATIGSAAFAVELMATGIRISEVARQLCQTRNVRLPERFLADDYLDMMVSRIQKAWIESGGVSHSYPSFK